MKQIAIGLLLAAISGPAWGQTCTSLPYTLTNGTVANADQVMANLNCLALKGGGAFNGQVTITGPTDYNAGLKIQSSGPIAALDINVTSAGGHWYRWEAGGTGGSAFANGGFGLYDITAGAARIAVSATGGVGIGTITPLRQFHISGSSSTELLWEDVAVASASNGRIWRWRNANGSFILDAMNGTLSTGLNAMTVLSGGNVGIGTSTPSKLLYVNGSAGGTQSWNQASDGRLKTNITPVTGGLALVEQLNPVRYEWRKPADRTVGKDLKLPVGERQIGFIAQEVEKVVPEAVSRPAKGSSETYGLKQDNLIPVLVVAIKELQAEVRAQRDQIEALKARQ